MGVARLLVGALLVSVSYAAPATDTVETQLVGTWKLDWPRPNLYWAVRADGVYRMHGPGAAPRQLGKLSATLGRFSMASAVWVDSGTYRLSGDTLVITGKLGPGTWRRIWVPAKSGASQDFIRAGACALVSRDEAARILSAPVTGGPDPRAGQGGCVFHSQLSDLDALEIGMRRNAGGFFQNHRKGLGARVIDVPGVGNQAYADVEAGTLQFLRGDAWITIGARLQPSATLDDLPYLAELARAADRRLPGVVLP
jgi:hypothetical protein